MGKELLSQWLERDFQNHSGPLGRDLEIVDFYYGVGDDLKRENQETETTMRKENK